LNKLLKFSFRVVAYLVFLLVVVFFLLEFFLTVTNIRLQNTYFEYEPDMGYRTIPYQHGSNHFGFNDRDYSFQKPAGVYCIVVLGDSFNWIGGRESNYVRFLQENFSKKMPNREIEVINAGYIGTHTGEQFSALKKYAMQYDPDLVVLGFFTGNDFIEANPERIKIIVNGVEVNVKKGEYLEFKNFPVIFKSRLFFLMLHKVKFKIAIPKDKKMGTFRKEVFLMLEKQRMSFYSIKNIKNDLYIRRLGADPALAARLATEHARAVAAILAIRDTDRLLDGQEVLRTSITLRNPYVDPLSLLQVVLLERKRALPETDPARAALDRVIGTVTNGIAQGLRNTG
jgi:hypothetical protein